MKPKISRMNALKQMFIENGGWIDKEAACSTLSISNVTLSRYIQSLRIEGLKIISKEKGYLLTKNNMTLEERVPVLTKAHYVSLKVLIYIYNHHECKRKDLIRFFCGNSDTYTCGHKMSVRNLDMHLSKLLNENLIKKFSVNGQICYNIDKCVMPVQILPFDQCLEILEYLKVSKPYLPFHHIIEGIETKIYGVLMQHIRKVVDELDRIRLMDRTFSASIGSSGQHENEEMIQQMHGYCNECRLLQIYTTKNEMLKIIPLRIIYNWENKKWYLVFRKVKARKGLEMLKLDKIQRVLCEEEESALDTVQRQRIGEDINIRQARSFGMALDNGLNVGVLFMNHFNVVEKAKKQLERHVGEMRLLGDGSLYYFGAIYGVMDFLAWVRRFGSSAVIISPIWLRKKHLQSAYKSLDNYGVEYERLNIGEYP